MHDEAGFVTDYRPAIPRLEALGWIVDCIPWRREDIHWPSYDAVYIGAPWDYTDDPTRFMDVLEEIEAAGCVLVNPLALVRWNLAKTYLRELQGQGIAVVPSLWYSRFAEGTPESWFAHHGVDVVVIKPQIGANAADTFVVEKTAVSTVRPRLGLLFEERPFMVQPFVNSIRTTGEYSLFYLGGSVSHAIRKVPKRGDFRVQEEHGADILATDPPADLVYAGDRVLDAVSPSPVYARADFVRGDGGEWLLMELELIEPSLYLRMHVDAAERFARAFDTYVRKTNVTTR